MQSTEEWRDVRGYEGYYEVSSLGRVRSVPRVVYRRNCVGGISTFNEPGRMLSAIPTKLGYPRVHLSRDGVRWKAAVHILVCEAFHGPRPDRMEAAHGDSDPNNPHADNIRWATPKENAADRIENGTAPVGANHPKTRLTDADVTAIRAARLEKRSVLAARYGLSLSAISKIRGRASWKHLSA